VTVRVQIANILPSNSRLSTALIDPAVQKLIISASLMNYHRYARSDAGRPV